MNVHRMKRQFSLAILSAVALLLPATFYGADSQRHQPGANPHGYRCVFMGHSFFYPIAETFGQVAVTSGFPDHKQLLHEEGATKGTPGWLWSNLPRDDEAWTELATEDVDLLCFPYHHISGCKLEDFCNWIDYARKRNPDIMIAIAIPWGPLCDVEPKEFRDFYRTRMEIPVHELVDALRKKYPDNAIFAIPHGKGVIELYAKFRAGEIPEIKQVVQPEGNDAVEAFFSDTSAHIGRMPLVLSQLIWLATIYQVDVRQCPWETGYHEDLKQMAYDIVRNDPYAKIPRKHRRYATPDEHGANQPQKANGPKPAPF